MKRTFEQIVKYIILVFFALLILFPVYMVISGSFKTEFELYSNVFGFPDTVSFKNYVTAFIDGNLKNYFMNSVVVTVCSVILIVLLSSMAAFALARLKVRFHNAIYRLFILGIAIPAQVGIIQLSLMMSKLHLTNSLFGLILVYIAFELPFSVFVFYGYLQTFPNEIQEAAIVDGCNKWQLYWNVIMLLCKNSIATVVIFDLVAVWNDVLFPLVLISKEKLRTLPYGLMQFRGQYSARYTVIFAGVIIITIPLTALYLCMQKQFISGLTQGAVKG